MPGTFYNVYCDESCHLQNDGIGVMLLGAVWCPESKKGEITSRIKDIKKRHNLPSHFEIKWNKVSKSKIDFYGDIVDFFFDDDDLQFRAVLVPDKKAFKYKGKLNHDTYYYALYFQLMLAILDPDCAYNIYVDIKDTKGQQKLDQLQEFLCNPELTQLDFSKKIIKRIQQVRSHEVPILQMTDVLLGAIGYTNRGLGGNVGKMELIEKIKKRTGYSLMHSTLPKEKKLNLTVFKPRENNG